MMPPRTCRPGPFHTLHSLLVASMVIGVISTMKSFDYCIRRQCCFSVSNHQFTSSHIANRLKNPISIIRDDKTILNQSYLIHKIGCGTRHSALCGIKGFRGWFESTFPTSMKSVDVPQPQRQFISKGGRKVPIPPQIDASNKNSLPQIYDHVLIDANQYLHSTLRRAYNRNVKKRLRNETINWELGLDDETLELSLVFFFRELDNLLTSIAIPRKNVVIALDGAPGAAKLDIQRERRFGIYRKAETQQKQIRILKERGWTDSDFGINSASNLKGIENIIFAKHDREQISLNISPGTKFMDRVTDTLLYWAWSAMSQRHWPIANIDGKSNQVKIFISPSDVAGEGEVKLIDWLVRGHDSTKTKPFVKTGDSVAIVGGDSDLVLMGLIVPPSITHDINILLPRELKKTSFYVASLWDSTKMLAKYLTGEKIYGASDSTKRKTPPKSDAITLDVMRSVKLDSVMLVIMNGNDYLPKIKGVVGGFDSFFTQYFKMIKAHLKNNMVPTFLLSTDNNTLSINVPFFLKLFKRLLKFQPPRIKRVLEEGVENSQLQLGILNNLCEAKMLPNPVEISKIGKGDGSCFQSELSKMKSKLKTRTQESIDTVYGKDIEIVRLTLGDYNGFESSKWNTTMLGESDGHGVVSRMISGKNNAGRSYLFEVPHRRGTPIGETKHRLACLALEEIFGKENMDLFGYDDSDNNDEEDNDEKLDRVSSNVPSYLAGLLWTLETYQKGVCPDWGYNYGQRVSAPTVFEIVEFLEGLNRDGIDTLQRNDLINDTATPPLPAGLTCAAALPIQAWNLVPEPYNKVWSPEDFEDMYKSCIDTETAVFDMEKFQMKCAASLKKIRTKPKQNDAGNTRNIYTGSSYWTVISRASEPLRQPFAPPKPYTSRAFVLRPNRRIKATKLAAVSNIIPNNSTSVISETISTAS